MLQVHMEVPQVPTSRSDWAGLPAGVLRQVCCQASTWQAPGSCLAAPVCRSWQSAAAGCRGVRLLYHANKAADYHSFVSWLGHGSRQLESLILVSSYHTGYPGLAAVVAALTVAAEQAAAAGRPLPLQVLRVVSWHGADLSTAGRLVACLPKLRVLQLRVLDLHDYAGGRPAPAPGVIQHHLAHLPGATQLQELYLTGSSKQALCNDVVAQLFPVSLKHLSWDGEHSNTMTADLSHLTQLTALRLLRWSDISSISTSSIMSSSISSNSFSSSSSYSSSKLPPGVQQLELHVYELSQEVLEEQQGVLAVLPFVDQARRYWRLLDQLSNFTNLGGLRVEVHDFGEGGHVSNGDLAQLPSLSALTVPGIYDYHSIHPLAPAASSIPRLRWLTLSINGSVKPPPGLSTLTGLQRLTLQMAHGGCTHQQAASWRQELGGLTGLKWLSVPNGVVGTLAPWLGSLQQLRVLMVVWSDPVWYEGRPVGDVSSVPWLEGLAPSMLPPRLQLLGVTGAHVDRVGPKQLRRLLQRALGSSKSDVVLGVDLDEVGDGLKSLSRWPHGLLAGWPQVLQQALA